LTPKIFAHAISGSSIGARPCSHDQKPEFEELVVENGNHLSSRRRRSEKTDYSENVTKPLQELSAVRRIVSKLDFFKSPE
jgi:hypothetical protein